MNKQGNTYTILYITVLVCVVGAVLAWVSLTLKPEQDANIEIDTKKQILSSIGIESDQTNALELYDKYVVNAFIVNSKGEKLSDDKTAAFNVSVSAEAKKPAEERQLPVFVCNVDNSTKYILPVYGAGLWGPIWGYVSVNDDGNTVYGAFFSHSGETPGLGAEIAKPAFSGQFAGKRLFKDGEFTSIAVEKKGQKPANGADYVDGVSGGTITSKGVQTMLSSCLSCYTAFLTNLQNKN